MRILIAYDSTEPSELALEKAAEIATAEKAEVLVLSVITPDARGSKSGGHMGLRPHADSDVARAKKYLADRGIEAATEIAHGHAGEEILSEARAGGYDLIVVGSRELGPIVGRVLGSVSRKVVHDAPCAVVVAGKSGATRVEPTATATA